MTPSCYRTIRGSTISQIIILILHMYSMIISTTIWSALRGVLATYTVVMLVLASCAQTCNQKRRGGSGFRVSSKFL